MDSHEIGKYKYNKYLEENNKTRSQKITQTLDLNSNPTIIRKIADKKNSEMKKSSNNSNQNQMVYVNSLEK